MGIYWDCTLNQIRVWGQMVDAEDSFRYVTSGILLFEKCMRLFVRHSSESAQTGTYSRFSEWFRRFVDADFKFEDQLLLVSQKGKRIAFPRPLPTVNFQLIKKVGNVYCSGTYSYLPADETYNVTIAHMLHPCADGFLICCGK